MPVVKVPASEFLGGTSAVAFTNPAVIRGLRRLKQERARAYAVRAHGDQSYGVLPYVHHLEAVVQVLKDFGHEGDYLVAGWLHDVVEDTPATVEDLAKEFGPNVAKLVDAVSGGGDRESHTASIYCKIAGHPDAAVVKLADRIANIENCEPGDKHAGRYQREHAGFTEAIRPFAPDDMWDRYEVAIRSRSSAVVKS